MQVRKRLKIITVISILTACIVVLILVAAMYQVKRAVKEQNIASEIIDGAFERIALRSDYVLNNNERARIQWFATHEKVGRLLRSASDTFVDDEDKKIVTEMLKDHESLFNLFSRIVENRAATGPDAYTISLSEEKEKRLISQLNMKVYATVLFARRLHESSGMHLLSILRQAGWGVMLIIAFVTAAAFVNSLSIGRTIASRIIRLRDGAAIIGRGNLDHRIDIKGNDEFAELADSFNEMTAKVRSSYHNLEKEIEERKQIEEALRRSNSFNQSIIDSSRDCIKILDMDGRLQYMSPGGQELLRIKDIGIYLNVPYEEFWKGTDREAVVEVIHKAKQGQGGSFQGFCPTADGTPKWWDVGISPILGTDGRPESLLAVSRDITERRRAEAELLKLSEDIAARNVELEAANRELDAFSYSVSHDLRAPLRSIDGFSQALIEDYGEKLDNQGKDFLRRVRAGSQRMAQLIDDLLNLSQLTRSNMSHGPVNLSVLAHKVADELRETQPGRKVEYIIADGVMAEGDEKLLQLVLENLLGNAWKFTGKTPEARIEFGALFMQDEISEGGVTVTDVLTEQSGIEERELSPSEREKTVYCVRDNGIGFDMSYSGKLGMPFQRLHAAGEFPGTGIGLATVKRIINRHGGRFWMKGELGKGATAYFTL